MYGLPKVADVRGTVHYFQGTDAKTGDHIPWCGIDNGEVFLFLTEGQRVPATETVTCDDCLCRTVELPAKVTACGCGMRLRRDRRTGVITCPVHGQEVRP